MILAGAFFRKIQDISVTEPLLALVLGVLVGPDALNIIKSSDSESELKVLEIACQFTISMALMATALRLPGHIFRKNAASLSNLLIFGMIFM
jgi:NhaP-type Na+/H+ or K+/H+ antiporter